MACGHTREPPPLIGVPTAPGVGFGPLIDGDGRGGRSGVLAVPDVTPADVVALDPSVVVAVATAAGAPLSHAAILARSLGIPAVTGLGRALLEITPGTPILVDGDTGTVSIGPTPDEMDAARRRQVAVRQAQDGARRHASEPAVTLDGQVVPVVVNVGGAGDARLAVVEGADGVGMLRTEFAFLGRTEPPDEEEQYLAYRGVADTIGDLPLVVRTLDLGADVPAWDAAPEPNPALGNRGLRFTLAEPELFGTQLRAVVRLAADRPVGVMFPMVTTVDELRRARASLAAVAAGWPGPHLTVGITVEVPGAALTAAAFAPLVDFFAIGTNDLTQYTLAADRANAAVAGIADGLHPGVLRLIREVTSAAAPLQRTVCVVGELGSDPAAIPILLGLGVTALSVRPNAVAAVKQVIRTVSVDEARALAGAALAAESAAAVRSLAAGRVPRARS